ncbi:MAG: endonuclease V [Candidatus Bathyarchaeia archaeon]|nr:endonuclease V [Candidatus Bathyarchaeota archaeon]
MNLDFSVEKAHKAQLQLSKLIILEDKLPEKIRFVGGVDTAYVGDLAISAAAILEFDSLKVVEVQTVTRKVTFPYVPTLLSFRELPSTLLCIKRLKTQPDVFLVDGQGFAHPYRCGFASHLGVVLGRPTIGVAKSRLIGEVEPFQNRDFAYLRDGNEVIGAAVKTITGKLLYVSVGHMVSLETAIKIVKHCTRDSLSEPIRVAHEAATAEKRKLAKCNILEKDK